MVNHFEFEFELTNKKYMFLNFISYCDSVGINPFLYIPLTLVLNHNTNGIKQNIASINALHSNIQNFVVKKLDAKPHSEVFYQDYFTLGHRSYALNNKSSTIIVIPETHVGSSKCTWILKPTDLCGGQLIKLISNLEDLEKYIRKIYEGLEKNSLSQADGEESEEEVEIKGAKVISTLSRSTEKKSTISSVPSNGYNPKYRSASIILQKYIERPFLYMGRKFDMRMWVLINYNMKVYMFQEGHLKTSSVEYSPSSNSKFVHITNYSLQKKGDEFNKHEEGNEVSFDSFQNFLTSEYEKGSISRQINVKRDFYPQFHKIIQLSINSVKEKINKKRRNFCFLILGYDFIVDESFKVWLLEINKNPGLSFSSDIIRTLVPRMIDDCMKLTIDTLFERAQDSNEVSNFPIKGYSNKENMWAQLIID